MSVTDNHSARPIQTDQPLPRDVVSTGKGGTFWLADRKAYFGNEMCFGSINDRSIQMVLAVDDQSVRSVGNLHIAAKISSVGGKSP